MKKKTVVGIIIGVIITIILFMIGVYFFVPISNEQILIVKANLLYDTSSKCEGHFGEVAGMAFTEQKCQLCNKHYESNTTRGGLCFSCSDITNRCRDCGKISDI